MSDTLTVAPRQEFHTLFDAPLVLDLDSLSNVGAHVCILGLPYGAPYSMEDVTNDQSNAPTAIRRAWQRALRAPLAAASCALDKRHVRDAGGPERLRRQRRREAHAHGQPVRGRAVARREHPRRAVRPRHTHLSEGKVLEFIGLVLGFRVRPHHTRILRSEIPVFLVRTAGV